MRILAHVFLVTPELIVKLILMIVHLILVRMVVPALMMLMTTNVFVSCLTLAVIVKISWIHVLQTGVSMEHGVHHPVISWILLVLVALATQEDYVMKMWMSAEYLSHVGMVQHAAIPMVHIIVYVPKAMKGETV